jgi:hypothetical protein
MSDEVDGITVGSRFQTSAIFTRGVVRDPAQSLDVTRASDPETSTATTVRLFFSAFYLLVKLAAKLRSKPIEARLGTRGLGE